MKTKFILAASLLFAASLTPTFANYYLLGQFNGWNETNPVAFSYNNETGAYTLTQEIEGEFKIKDDQGTWLGASTNPNFVSPTVALSNVPGNMSVPSKSTYTFTIINNNLTVSGYNLYLAGSFNNWGAPLKMTDNGDGTYSINYLFPKDTRFKIRDSEEGGHYYGAVSNGEFYVLNTMYSDLSLAMPGENFYIQRSGPYTLTINSEKKLTVDGFPPTPLSDLNSNTSTLAEYNNKTVDVQLEDRIFNKGNVWNTLCLPFDISAEELAEETHPFYGADIRTFTGSTFSNGELTLNFSAEGNVTSISAGTPYFVRWSGEGVIDRPVFKLVTIKNVSEGSAGGEGPAIFQGCFNAAYINGSNYLYLGAANTLYYPSSEVTVGAFRAYFELTGGITAGEPTSTEPESQGIKSFVLNFGDDNETTSIKQINNTESATSTWFTLDGRRLNDKPATAGLYIINGKKVVIK